MLTKEIIESEEFKKEIELAFDQAEDGDEDNEGDWHEYTNKDQLVCNIKELLLKYI